MSGLYIGSCSIIAVLLANLFCLTNEVN